MKLLSFVFLILITGAGFVDLKLTQNLQEILLPPSLGHWMGTDALGRDLLARILLATKCTLTIGLLGTFISSLIGVLFGFISAMSSQRYASFYVRILDLFSSLPPLIWMSVLITFYDGQRGVLYMGLIIGFSHWMSLARSVRSLVRPILKQPYIDAARAIGLTNFKIAFRHIYPNIKSGLSILIFYQLPQNIFYEGTLSFLGIGLEAPDASWGLIANEGNAFMVSSPHMILFPSLILFITLFSMHSIVHSFKKGASYERRYET